MEQTMYDCFVRILKKELVPALGCTEPIALAYAAAKARQVLGTFPERVVTTCSGNIIKNVKGVVVPATGGLRGIEAATLIGAVGGDPERKLEVLTGVTDEDRARVRTLLEEKLCTVRLSDSSAKLHILVEMTAGDDTALVEILHSHTNIVRIEKNGRTLFRQTGEAEAPSEKDPDYALLDLEHILEFAETVRLDDIREILDRQIQYNLKIAEAGLSGTYGGNVGKTLREAYGDSFDVMARALPAAGSDARMSGCELPVVIICGSGNQGMTASLPVIACAKELGVSEEKRYRALCVSNLTAVYQKRDIGRLSAYCGAVSAAAGAGVGMMYLRGGSLADMANVLTCTLADVGGILCDGAKSSCAAKIASSVEAALLAIRMTEKQRGFGSGEGFIKDTIGETVAAISTIAREGMQVTDEVILDVMINR
ncbi:L-cysteine desulfidase family protein [Candidatus Avoscillospira sp. LCP25S3_F1]|uniref:L-cysteine desulfidase family protein n=1 Tax=Candidatus Avoscillospira sp. LCP25S3_F1 TaxID=3438825 RepID=UPI003F93E391